MQMTLIEILLTLFSLIDRLFLLRILINCITVFLYKMNGINNNKNDNNKIMIFK